MSCACAGAGQSDFKFLLRSIEPTSIQLLGQSIDLSRIVGPGNLPAVDLRVLNSADSGPVIQVRLALVSGLRSKLELWSQGQGAGEH